MGAQSCVEKSLSLLGQECERLEGCKSSAEAQGTTPLPWGPSPPGTGVPNPGVTFGLSHTFAQPPQACPLVLPPLSSLFLVLYLSFK